MRLAGRYRRACRSGPTGRERCADNLAQTRLAARERPLDLVEVGTVGPKEAQSGANRFGLLLYGRPLVVRELGHDDDVTGAKLGHQDQRHMGFKPVAIVRPVEHDRRDQSRRRRRQPPAKVAHPQPDANAIVT